MWSTASSQRGLRGAQRVGEAVGLRRDGGGVSRRSGSRACVALNVSISIELSVVWFAPGRKLL
jgi:hypothetical protein